MTLTKHDFTAFHWVEIQDYEPAKIVSRGGGDCMDNEVKAKAEFSAIPNLPLTPGTCFAFTSEELPDLLRGIGWSIVDLDETSGRVRVVSGFIP